MAFFLTLCVRIVISFYFSQIRSLERDQSPSWCPSPTPSDDEDYFFPVPGSRWYTVVHTDEETQSSSPPIARFGLPLNFPELLHLPPINFSDSSPVKECQASPQLPSRKQVSNTDFSLITRNGRISRLAKILHSRIYME